MAYDLGAVIAHLRFNLAEFKDNVNQVRNQTKTMKSDLQNFTDGVKNVAGVFGVALGAAGLVGYLKKSVEAFEQSQAVMAQTNAVLKSTGGVAGVTAEQVRILAQSLQQQSKYSDESIQSAENLILTFTNINKDIFPETIGLVLDMSQAMGQDLNSSAIQIGKALQDPILGVTALRRVGVNFNETQADTIRKLVEGGQAAKAQAMILKELSTEFGGSAAAAAQTFSGRMAIMKNNIDDVAEVVGEALAPALLMFIDIVDGNASSALSSLRNNLKVIQIAFVDIATVAIVAAKIIAGALSIIGGAVVSIFSLSFKPLKEAVYTTAGSISKTMDSMNRQIVNIANNSGNQQVAIAKRTANAQQQESSKTAQKIAKDLEEETRKFEQENKKREASFKQSLADLVRAHMEKRDALKQDIAQEDRDFKENMSDRVSDFQDRMADFKQTHEDKVAEIEQQLADEVAKGEEADQAQIKSLQDRLLKENTEYEAQKTKNEQRFAAEQERLQRDHDEKVAKLQNQLTAEEELLKKHESDVNMVKDQAMLDDIDRLKKQYEEENANSKAEHERRLVEIRERGDQLGSNLGSTIDAGLAAQKPKIEGTMGSIASSASKNLADGISKGAYEAGHELVKNFVKGFVDKAKDLVSRVGEAVAFSKFGPLLPGKSDLAKLQGFAEGGVIPGAPGEPRIVLAHGQETIVPYGKSGMGGNVYISMDGALISDSAGAMRMGELIGDQIIKKLNTQIRH